MDSILARKALIVYLIGKMQENGSWTGETHIQKCTYFSEHLLNVSLNYNFILYKHGPFSFDLREELIELRADNFIEMRPRKPFGPSFIPGKYANVLRSKYQSTIDNNQDHIDFIVEKLSNKNVKELERVATALYVKNNEKFTNDGEVVDKIIELKPHIKKSLAEDAVKELNSYIQEYNEKQLV